MIKGLKYTPGEEEEEDEEGEEEEENRKIKESLKDLISETYYQKTDEISSQIRKYMIGRRFKIKMPHLSKKQNKKKLFIVYIIA